MRIGPRRNEFKSRTNHIWSRDIGGVEFCFDLVKSTRFETPYIMVSREDTGELVRCSCPRNDCPVIL